MTTIKHSTVLRVCSLLVVLTATMLVAKESQPSSCILETNGIDTLWQIVESYIAQGIKAEEISIAFDMDETLVTTYLEVNGKRIDFPQSRFFDFLKATVKTLNTKAGIAAPLDAIFARNNAIVTHLLQENILKTRPMEAHTLQMLDALQAKKVNVFILTARPFFAAERTEKLLGELNITLQPSFLKTPETMIDTQIGCAFKNGVLYAQKGKIDKGDAMAKFFAAHDYKPRVLIAIDDRIEYLDGIERALQSWTDVSYKGIWYRRAEAWGIDDALAHQTLEAHLGDKWWAVARSGTLQQ
ncbi:DUF2608 domain-containing protein [Candidatus Dependentiae bacterium]|nr:DUF2608 domain-containing protein [Candidatus Dependentiae bacterium]